MKKIFLMLTALLAFNIASAQTETSKKRTESVEDKATMKSTDQNNAMTPTEREKRKAQKKAKEAPTTTQPAKRERANGTVGTIEYPDTQGAGTGTGNDTRIGTPPGQPEPGTEPTK